MKHHVLLGLILGLLATARLGGQPSTPFTGPVLFSVEFNNSTNLVTITGTGSGATTNLPGDLNSYFNGITLLNFFSVDTGQTWGEFGPSLGNEARTLSISIGSNSDYLDPISVETNISTPGAHLLSFGDAQTQLYNYNLGQNLVLLGTSNPGFSYGSGIVTFSFSGLVEIVYSGTRDITNNSSPGIGFQGPLYVYAGANSAANGDAFLGTYTITVVPEPSTYAAIAGGLGLVAAVLHRRRQRSRASAA
jgi:hypothetical protein